LRIETQAREVALKAVYQHDLLGDRSLEQLREFCAELAPADVAEMAMELVEGLLLNQDSLDGVIRRTAENWELERMATSDRNILRLGVYELLHRHQTPPKVAINEAIELAKKYSTANSATFVNGVLDKIYTMEVAPREQAEPGSPGSSSNSQPDPTAQADLHVHSTASDGSVPPAELPALAAKAGLRAIALTDHDSLAGILEAMVAAQAAGIELIPGVELTCYLDSLTGEGDVELHVVGLFVDVESAALQERLVQLRVTRAKRVTTICGKLHALGVPLDCDAVMARAAGGAVGRAHVAQEMVEQGYCKDIQEVFQRYIAPGCPAYVPKDRMTPAECFQLIHDAGGCSVLCHAGLMAGYKLYIERLVAEGLDALEVHYPTHSAQDEKALLDIARRHGMGVSGGSDFHGAFKPHVGLGQESVSFIELEDLRRRAGVSA